MHTHIYCNVLNIPAVIETEWIHFSGTTQNLAHNSPHNKRRAYGPSGSKVWIFKDRGILCEGVVMNDGGLLVVEGLPKKPLLMNEEYETLE